MYMQRYDISFKGGIASWEGPIAYLMFVQFFLLSSIVLLPEFLWWLTLKSAAAMPAPSSSKTM